jgi:F420-dependent oxidoreductase-like protein
MTKLGFQIPNFTYPGVDAAGIFPNVVRQAAEAEGAGFDTVMVMDHFNQLPMLGPQDNDMLECYTVLSALASTTSHVRLGALVTGNTYRNPALLAKTVTTLDIVSGGRAQLGIGAGWFEEEHVAYGYEFGTFSDRFARLEEALSIILPMLRGERPTVSGEYYSAVEAINEPQPISRIPVMIGGSGEKKTLRMVAQYADLSNLTCGLDEVDRKLDALAGHCDRLGRTRGDITVSLNMSVVIGDTHEQARAEFFDALQRVHGLDAASASPDEQAFFESQVTLGDPDTVGERLAEGLASGVDGLTLSLPVQSHIDGRIAMLGAVAAPLVFS